MTSLTPYNQLYQKYDIPCPRYTSYPTVPLWDDNFTSEDFKGSLISHKKGIANEGISLYIHLPFCEELCTYCGCNKRITKNHSVELPYIIAVLQEWELYSILLEEIKIKEIHLGGGTPTFFSPDNLNLLISSILKNCIVSDDFEFSVEVHPNFTTKEHMDTLAKLGFKRISVGIQDFDPKVQFIINRIQSFDKTKEVIDYARKVGFNSVNADIIYGLPLQTKESIKHTIDCIKKLRPDRIAFYSYAHVPWKSKGQRRYNDADLPSGEYKRELYVDGKLLLKDAGYMELGMDHFALASDTLFKAFKEKKLHRNFMGYTVYKTKYIIGLGVSSISDLGNAYYQNEKEMEKYKEKIHNNHPAIEKGHHLTPVDQEIRNHILALMCQYETELKASTAISQEIVNQIINRLKFLKEDGLVTISGSKVKVTETGKSFVRNIASCFDIRLHAKEQKEKIFSRAI
ncbi:MAG: oxygen-independent coproporphyrinogen III oxidase [Cytophagaceae bacterium]